MLTRADQTVTDGLDVLDVLDDIRPLGLTHLGFKDVGGPPATLAALSRRIREMVATRYLEVVSTSPASILLSARVARDIGIDRLLGETQVEAVLAVLAGCATPYLPFPGRPFDHPTKLAGSAADEEADCRRFQALGCAGVELLACRATEAEPLDLVRAARHGRVPAGRRRGPVRRSDPGAGGRRRGRVHHRLGRVRRLVRTARRLAAFAAEGGPRCVRLTRSPSRSPAPTGIP